MSKKKPSISRLQARELERKIMPAIKLISQYMHKTAADAPEETLHGYVCSAGWMKLFNKKWQLQIRVVCTKKEYVKEDQIHPIINKRAWGFKLRLFSKALIDKIFAD